MACKLWYYWVWMWVDDVFRFFILFKVREKHKNNKNKGEKNKQPWAVFICSKQYRHLSFAFLHWYEISNYRDEHVTISLTLGSSVSFCNWCVYCVFFFFFRFGGAIALWIPIAGIALLNYSIKAMNNRWIVFTRQMKCNCSAVPGNEGIRHII